MPEPTVQIVVSDEFKAPLAAEDQFEGGFPVARPPDPFQFPAQTATTHDEGEFQPAQNFQFAASDFDFLLSRGNNKPSSGEQQEEDIPRDSLLLRFDPLLKAPVVARLSSTKEEEEVGFGGGLVELCQQPLVQTAPAVEEELVVGQQQPQQLVYDENNEQQDVGEGVLLTALEASGFIAVSPTPSNRSAGSSNIVDEDVVVVVEAMDEGGEETKNQLCCADEEAEDEKMSVDNTMVMECSGGGGEGSGDSITADRNMSFAETDQDFNGGGGVGDGPELDKKTRNESLKIDELERKLAEAEQREEQLLKRITDKDKTISKMTGVVEAYERAIAELIAEKEQITQNYEKTCEALKADSDINAQHLESLEKTFSDLHAKYERMKIISADHKEREEELVNERNRFEESLRMQEKRYENMKGHAMTQLETANNKLSELVRNHAQEVTKLKALLKKEEIYRASVNEQLNQKARENEELVKICEELINGGAN